jgi:hypothetical protein
MKVLSIDSRGNKVFQEETRLYLQLSSEERPRHIGDFIDGIYKKSISTKHIFRKFNAVGYNSIIVERMGTKSFEVSISGKKYWFTREEYDMNKKYLDFNKMGFEIQCFMPIRKMHPCE